MKNMTLIYAVIFHIRMPLCSVYLFLERMFPMGDPKKDQELGIAKICLGE